MSDRYKPVQNTISICTAVVVVTLLVLSIAGMFQLEKLRSDVQSLRHTHEVRK